jgi:hypothetical protein
MKQIVFLFVFFAFLPGATHAAMKYKPGSVGFLYENCRNALAASTSAENLYETYCGGFTEGYLSGMAVSNWIKLPEPGGGDPCFAEKAQAYVHINRRICPNLPQYTEKMTPDVMLRLGADIVSRWVDSLSEEERNKQASIMMGSLTAPGTFCASLESDTVYERPFPEINPALETLSWKDYLRIKGYVTLERKHMQCVKDLQHSNGSLNKFRATWCGAEIMGFLAGVRSMEHLQNREKVEGACGKELDRLYKSLDVKQTMCVGQDTDIMHVAQVFIDRFEGGLRKSQGFMNSGNLGAVGYETIYRGFMCTRP